MDKMPKFLISLMLFFLYLPGSASAEGYFLMTGELEMAYDEIIHLRFEKGQEVLDDIRRREPDNLLVNHIENYIDFLKVFIGEDRSDLKAFEANKERRLEAISRGDPSSPYFKFSQAEIYLQWAIARAKFGEYFRAGWDINKAYKLLKQNVSEFPDFELNKKSLALIHTLVGSVTGVKKGLLRVFTSLEGSIEQGIDEIDELYNADAGTHGLFHEEIRIIRAMMALHIEDDEELAFYLIHHPDLKHHSSALIVFFKATIASRTGHAPEALEVLSRYTPIGDYPFHYLNFIKGRALLNTLDSSSYEFLKKYVDHYKGGNYLKEAFQKLAWYEWIINKNASGYHSWMARCLTEGQAEVGEDEQALEEARRHTLPNRGLLTARLLFDADLYERSMKVLEDLAIEDLDKEERIEYYYRRARNLQLTDHWEEAIKDFGMAIHLGSPGDSYFACNGSLQVARMLVDRVSCHQALQYLEICRSIKPAEHSKSIHQKALVLKERIESGATSCSPVSKV